MTSNELVLEAEGVSKRFGGLEAVRGVNLSLSVGARHALIGPNGAGKTTLINLLSGVLQPTAGRVVLLRNDISQLEPHKRVRQGLVRTFQINQLFGSLTPLKTLALAVSETLGLTARPWNPFGRNKRVLERTQELLEKFHLISYMNHKIDEMPYGKRRQLEIAIALACEPKVLLLDEPVAGVPMGEREDLIRTVSELPQSVAILLIEHDIDLVFSFANQVTVMVNGAVEAEGTPEQIAANQAVQQAYLGNAIPNIARTRSSVSVPQERVTEFSVPDGKGSPDSGIQPV